MSEGLKLKEEFFLLTFMCLANCADEQRSSANCCLQQRARLSNCRKQKAYSYRALSCVYHLCLFCNSHCRAFWGPVLCCKHERL